MFQDEATDSMNMNVMRNALDSNSKNVLGQEENKLGEDLNSNYPFQPHNNYNSMIPAGRDSAPSYFFHEPEPVSTNFEFSESLPKMEENMKFSGFNRKS